MKFSKVAQASPTALAPLSSALFLARAKTSKLGVPLAKELAIISVPSGPKPQLLIKNLFKGVAYNKYLEKAVAPNGFTALSDTSNSTTFLPINPPPKNSKL